MQDGDGPVPGVGETMTERDVIVPRRGPAQPTDLSDRVAVVTGASSGLGWRIAVLLATNGARVVAVARRRDRLDALRAEIDAAGGSVLTVEADLCRLDDPGAIFDAAEQAFGTVNVLVNNAGVQDPGPPETLTLDDIDRSIATNVRAPFVLACEFGRRLMRDESPGHILNISSIGAFTYTGGGRALYSTTKAAVSRMTEALAVEWGPRGINVNALAPGAFASEMLDAVIEKIGDVTNNFPRRRYATPEDLDNAVLFLLSHASSFVSGTIVKVDDAGRPR